MRVTRRQLRQLIRESLSSEEASKIEKLYWIKETDEYGLPDGHPHRQQALLTIDALGVDPASLRVWEAVLPWGETYEPWEARSIDHTWGINGWVADPDKPGFTKKDVEAIVNEFNSQNENQLSVHHIIDKYGRYVMQMRTKTKLGPGSEWIDDMSDGVERAANVVMNP